MREGSATPLQNASKTQNANAGEFWSNVATPTHAKTHGKHKPIINTKRTPNSRVVRVPASEAVVTLEQSE